MFEEIGANEFTLEELDSLFNEGETQPETPPVENETQPETPPVENETKVETPPANGEDVSKTKAFANRLKASTEKARREEREAIAKSLGYGSYEELQKANEKRLLEEKGLDPNEVSPIVEEIVKQRLNNDPRMIELDELRKLKIEQYGKEELAKITQLTGGHITRFDQIPKEVIELWKKTGSLEGAYLQLEGKKLIEKARREVLKGTTNHLATPGGSPPATKGTRPLTDAEKKIRKQFHPKMTDEELNKKTVPI